MFFFFDERRFCFINYTYFLEYTILVNINKIWCKADQRWFNRVSVKQLIKDISRWRA